MKVHIWLSDPFSWRNNFMEECEAVSNCCIHVEVEFVAYFEATIQEIGYETLFQDLKFLTVLPGRWKFIVIISQPSSLRKMTFTHDAKHMELKYLVVKEKFQKQSVTWTY